MKENGKDKKEDDGWEKVTGVMGTKDKMLACGKKGEGGREESNENLDPHNDKEEFILKAIAEE